MNRRFVLLLLAAASCSPAAPITTAPTTHASATAPLPAPSGPKAPQTAQPTLTFVEKGPGVLDWDFEVKDIPAFDETTQTVVVADVSHGNIASSLSLVVRWFRATDGARADEFVVLDPHAASRVLYDLDESEANAELPKLAATARERTAAANAKLAEDRHHPLTRCTLAKFAGVCTHPQRITCGAQIFELEGDDLGGTKLGWSVAPMTIGPGPKKEMLTCIEDAYFDPPSRTFAARIMHACKGGGSDACFLEDEWRVKPLR